MQKSDVLAAFNKMFSEFCEDIRGAWPENKDLKSASISLAAIRKANPSLVCKIWKNIVVGRYGERIEAGDVDFFAQNDYANDFTSDSLAAKVLPRIDAFRRPLLGLEPSEKSKVSSYLKNLSALSSIYASASTHLNPHMNH